MSQMLGEQELKHYGEERSVSQQKFNEDVLSGDFMRFRRALYQNIAYGLRLLTWTNARGASLLHILCRDVKCTDTHSADDAADMLCKFAHGVVTANDFDGRIPLHEAVQRGQVRFLVKSILLCLDSLRINAEKSYLF
uniref:ANK_REP_REGION domain-containing protein n=1 Tax=Heterorhabditis bacteriophora TaxID=37862 RepID=A0A1I7X217_HETBA